MAKLGMGELEAAVMKALWDLGGWRTPREVHEVVSGDRPLAYTTVLTVLVRLQEKGRLERQRDGRAHAYLPVQSREEYAAERMAGVLSVTDDRSLVLNRFLRALTPGDRAQLRRMLKSQSQD